MVEISGISKRFGKKEVLHDISLSLDNAVYGLLGPNGAGKTTLLRVLAGYWQGQSPRRKVGYLPQKFGCFPNLTVSEQLQFFYCVKELPPKLQEKEVERVMELTNLQGLRGEKCRRLSGGAFWRLLKNWTEGFRCFFPRISRRMWRPCVTGF